MSKALAGIAATVFACAEAIVWAKRGQKVPVACCWAPNAELLSCSGFIWAIGL